MTATMPGDISLCFDVAVIFGTVDDEDDHGIILAATARGRTAYPEISEWVPSPKGGRWLYATLPSGQVSLARACNDAADAAARVGLLACCVIANPDAEGGKEVVPIIL